MRGQRWPARDRRWLVQALASGLAALALFSLLAFHFGYVPPGWNTNRRFGPFPNRNQTATLFATGAFLALVCGVDRLRRLQQSARRPEGMASFPWTAFFGPGCSWPISWRWR